MAWVAGDTFLVAHDAKRPEEVDWPRLSLVRLPDRDGGPRWTPLALSWPEDAGPSHDLESIARIPHTDLYLVLESGDDGSAHQRIYVCELAGGDARILEVVPWPVDIYNVEAAEVARIDTQLVFMFAERAHAMDETDLSWATITLGPLKFGSFESTPLPAIDPAGPHARPITALTIDSAGRLYGASALDPDNDTGPYRSVVWQIGRLERRHDGGIRVAISREPARLATLDGLKVESVAIREVRRGEPELFIGTDDEYYGGALRPLPTVGRPAR